MLQRNPSEWRRALERWWATLPPSVRSRRWQGAAAALTIAALLLAFHQVVAHAVRQGELLRMDTATHAQAVWRCNAMQDADLREACLDQLNSPPRREVHGPSDANKGAIHAQVAQWNAEERRR
jgi:hypothetical protein